MREFSPREMGSSYPYFEKAVQGGFARLNPPGEYTRFLELVTGQRDPEQRGPKALFPAPPHSTPWGGVSFLPYPAPVPAQAPAPPIPQTGPR